MNLEGIDANEAIKKDAMNQSAMKNKYINIYIIFSQTRHQGRRGANR